MSDETCWTMIRSAAKGEPGARGDFCSRYLPVVRNYLAERWRGSGLASEVEDAIQEVFLECLRPDGALDRFDERRASSFSAYLRAVVENVSRRVEERNALARGRSSANEGLLDAAECREERLTLVFQRDLSISLVRQARDRHRELSGTAGPEAERRFEILRLRFQEDLPLREIAAAWKADPAEIHRDYARAREEFKQALRDVIRFHNPSHPEAVEQECQDLLGLLG